MPDKQKVIETMRAIRYGDPLHFAEHAADLADAIIAAPVVSATVLKPGDRVLLVLDGVVYEREAQGMRETLEARFPGTTFTIASGVSEVVVQPADDGSAYTEFIGAAE